MTTSPFRSIAVAAQKSPRTALLADQVQQHAPFDSLIAGLFAKSELISAPAEGFENLASVLTSSSALDATSPPAVNRPLLKGGSYSEANAIALLNAHFFIGKSKQETAIFRINDDGSATFTPNEQFKLEVQNIFVRRGVAKPAPAETYWKQSSQRHERELVFKPGGTAGPHEFNLWRGFGVSARKGWQKQRRFLRHLHRVVCRRDKPKFRYLMHLLAWSVQNPAKHAGVVLVLKSREQGTGKSTVGKVMLDVFDQHGYLVDDKDRLLGRFTDWLETACFVLAEEILFAGDLKSADKMKSMVTGDVLQIERKFGSCRQVPNHLKVIATTNHDHAVAAGVRDRRYVVYDVSNEHVGDGFYFDALYRDLDDGGTSEFLWLLLNLRLGSWHPRMTIKTAETAEQQRMSGDSVSQWAQACVVADAVIGVQGQYGPAPHDLSKLIASEDLRTAYSGFCRQQGLRPVSEVSFGKACVEMFGPRRRLPLNGTVLDIGEAQRIEDVGEPREYDEVLNERISEMIRPNKQARSPQLKPGGATGRRPWGYYVPTGEEWQLKIDVRLGVRQ
ncbi:primase-helicase family protein [Bradyrhizobium sp. JYMT SZCCT0428]|uniref:primase-helicase family protein n=1 Tax=Bradyrhizobium sp. JYMT SZCCT0428 TaxID=2807673 RepID=UPI001BA53F7D|nr:primase-helicase family protein [Bradyrhizobium sp. JYMT SZCCT0428]MBR1153741.1 hypothetical protein [Bradyrhizobium sp. JYMT SZCCT0428]